MLYVLAFAGGVLAMASPCILPVLPFVLARADQPFRRSGLPMLAGMGLTFAAVGTLAAVTGEWVVRANQVGRHAAMASIAVFGAALVLPRLADWLARPFVLLGGAVQRRDDGRPSVGPSLLIGVSTGLLWTPCAGPILGLILAGAAIEGASARSALMLLAFAAGTVCALALALTAGGRMLLVMKRTLGADLWIRRVLGAGVLAGVVGVAMGWDTGVLARVSLNGAGATKLEQRLVDRVRPPAALARIDSSARMPAFAPQARGGALTAEGGPLPPLDGAVRWLNGPPQTRDGLRGKVVLVDFWTYSCINCLRALPYVAAWAEKYKDSGLVVIGVHSPEFAFERDPANVAKAVRDLKLTYPIAVDSNYAIWKAFNNRAWPAQYFVDARGRIRSQHLGEGDYEESERVLQLLLAERNAGSPSGGFVRVTAAGVQAAPDLVAVRSDETYIGYARQENYASPQAIAKDRSERYSAPVRPRVNQWGLDGAWTVGAEHAVLATSPGRIVFRFHARDLHLVIGPRADGTSIRFRVLLDGAPPLDDRGVDVDAQGVGSVTGYRLYQLIRQKSPVEDRTFQIEFLDPGVQVFAFTFG